MKGQPTGFNKAALTMVIISLMLGACRDSDNVEYTNGNGETHNVSVGEALICIFSLGIFCPARESDPYADEFLGEDPNMPRGISAVAASDGIPAIYLSWQAASAASRVIGYRIYRDGSPVADVAEPAYTDSLLDRNRGYCYTVVAIDEASKQSIPGAEACATTSWQIAIVKTDIREARPSIAVDALGQVHLAYVGLALSGTREIAYADNLSGSWRSEIVGLDDDVFTDAPAIAVDAAGFVHIGTLDKYITNVFGSWQAEAFEAHNFPAMALDSGGFVHLLSAASNGGLNHTTNIGGGWASEPVGNGAWQQSALVIDDRDDLHVVAYDAGERQLLYSTNAEGSWVQEVIADDFPPVWRLDLAVDAQRRLHLSYQTKQPDETGRPIAAAIGDGLGYASNSSGAWRFSRIDSGESVGAGSAIAVDSQGHVHISYTNRLQDELRYANNATGGWQVLTIDRGDAADVECELPEEFCGVTAIAIDARGRVHIGYHDRDRVLYISNR